MPRAPGTAGGGVRFRVLMGLLAAAVWLAGSWGAFHRVAHAPQAPMSWQALVQSLDDRAHDPALCEEPHHGLRSAVHSHDPASDTCRLLDQLACADGLLKASPALVPAPLPTPAHANLPAGAASAKAQAYQARAPPALAPTRA